MKYKIGDKVIITGELYYSSNDTKPASYVKDKKTTITRIAKGSRHPYNSTGDLGWCDEKSIRYTYEESEGDHSWKWWDMHIKDGLKAMFGE